ncbi:MAG: hypothetical protein ACYCQJ_10440 [Nitrososphaerales archaeon]
MNSKDKSIDSEKLTVSDERKQIIKSQPADLLAAVAEEIARECAISIAKKFNRENKGKRNGLGHTPIIWKFDAGVEIFLGTYKDYKVVESMYNDLLSKELLSKLGLEKGSALIHKSAAKRLKKDNFYRLKDFLSENGYFWE